MTKASGIVLYVEDEEMDRFLMERAFARAGLGEALRMVADGQQAVDYLRGLGGYANREKAPLPQVVLLDLNLPELHGFEVLKWIRAQPALCDLPVVIFSSSEREEDRTRAQELRANDFIKKPGSGLSFGDVVQKLNKQWLCGTASAKRPA